MNLEDPAAGLDAVPRAGAARHDASAQSLETRRRGAAAFVAARRRRLGRASTSAPRRSPRSSPTRSPSAAARSRRATARRSSSWKDPDPAATRDAARRGRRHHPRPAGHRAAARVGRRLERRVGPRAAARRRCRDRRRCFAPGPPSSSATAARGCTSSSCAAPATTPTRAGSSRRSSPAIRRRPARCPSCGCSPRCTTSCSAAARRSSRATSRAPAATRRRPARGRSRSARSPSTSTSSASSRGAPCRPTSRAAACALYGGLLWLSERHGLPIRLLEIGASAGLNLNVERFRYVVGGAAARRSGQPAGVRRAVDGLRRSPTRRRPPRGCGSPSARAATARRSTPTTHEGRLELQSYIWPDEPERIARVGQAAAVAVRHPVSRRAPQRGGVAARAARRSAAGDADRRLAVGRQPVPRRRRARRDPQRVRQRRRAAPLRVADARAAGRRQRRGRGFELRCRERPEDNGSGVARLLARAGYHGPPVASGRCRRAGPASTRPASASSQAPGSAVSSATCAGQLARGDVGERHLLQHAPQARAHGDPDVAQRLRRCP